MAREARRSSLPVETMELFMGPSHPAMHGTIKLNLVVDGEKVVKCDTEIGFLHRGFEKMSEQSTWTQVFPYTDRLNYVSAMMNNTGYAMAVEKLLDVDIPERAKYIRVIVCELSRISDHLTCIAANAMEMGAFTPYFYTMQARELIWRMFDALCGGRCTTNYVRIGGVSQDLPDGFYEEYKSIRPKLVELIDDTDRLLTKNRIFIDRMRGVSVVSAEMAINYGFTGPCLRASGVPYDVRKAHPYLVYDRLDFEIPTGEHDDNFDRYWMRMFEMRQSLRIVDQAFEQLPDGPVIVDDPRVALPPKEKVYNSIEGMICHFKLITDGIQVPAGEAYSYTEAANGELGFYVVSTGGGRPWKCRVRPPCFAIMQALGVMVEGEMIADIIPTFDTINMIGGECDR